MSSVFDFLFQGSPPPSVTADTTSQAGFPDWYQDLMRANIGNATSVASQPYQSFPGQQVATPTTDTTNSYDAVRSNVGSQDPSLTQASGALGNVAAGFNGSQLANYTNPYTTQVANTIQTLGNQNLMENVLPGVNDTFTGAGQFGSSRNGDFTNRAIRDNQQAISNAQGQALDTGVQNATNAYLQGQQNQVSAGQNLGTLGQVYQNTGLKDAAALDQIGQEQQTQSQQNLNTAYTNWQNQVAYPQNQATWLNSIIRGMAAPTTSSSSITYPSTMGGTSGLQSAAATANNVSNGGLGGLTSSYVQPAPIIG